MTAPITGPYSYNRTLNRVPDGVSWSVPYYSVDRVWYRQRRPFNVPLKFDFTLHEVTRFDDYRGGVFYGPITTCPPWNDECYFLAYNKAYSKFISDINEQAMWAVNLIEGRQAINSLVSRVTQLTRFTRFVARGRFAEASRELQLAVVPKGVSKKKSFANNWLEFHFGWEPLVKDIGVSLETAINPFTPRRIKVSAKQDIAPGFTRTGSPSESSYRDSKTIITTAVSIRGEFTVTNSNLFLASQMGFINPIAIAWELVPFSFVVDWFSNVGQVLGAMTDLMGVSVKDAHISSKQTSNLYQNWYYGSFQTPPGHNSGELFIVSQFTSVYARRRVGLDAPTLQVKPFKGFSSIRGATAISLLLQQLGRK